MMISTYKPHMNVPERPCDILETFKFQQAVNISSRVSIGVVSTTWMAIFYMRQAAPSVVGRVFTSKCLDLSSY